jgi:biopolymer transport protein ExbD
MNFRSRLRQEDEPLPITPMLDVVFLLLIFFMSTSIYYQLETELGITVPTASESQPQERTASEIIINVRKDGSILVNQREYELGGLERLLQRIGETFKGQPVIIRGDQETQFGRTVQVLNACAKADIWNVSFATLTEEPEQEGGS